MLSTIETALVLALACSALTACGGSAPARSTSESFSAQSRDAGRRDVSAAPLNRARGGI